MRRREIMQDIHHRSMISDGGGAGRFFGGGGVGDRRLRAHQNHHHHQALKCPRCNSLNTKFCYYNNYNLSQPRHFCKNCRRYWTKGGVLRNVPVGGGCRKTKRSKPKHPSAGESSGKPTPDAETEGNPTTSHSSSDSSSLSAAGFPPGSASAAEVASVPVSGFSTNNPRLYGDGIEWSAMIGQGSSEYGGLFTEMRSFTNVNSMAAAAEGYEMTPFGLGVDTMNLKQQCGGETVNEQMFEDRTAQDELQGNFGCEPLDWGGDQSLFDLTSIVDHTYWF